MKKGSRKIEEEEIMLIKLEGVVVGKEARLGTSRGVG